MTVPGGRRGKKQAKPAQLAGQNSLPGPQSAGQPADTVRHRRGLQWPKGTGQIRLTGGGG
ncbi:MAG: hypothetical protein WA888_24310 [Burkholderiaceae bacterium]